MYLARVLPNGRVSYFTLEHTLLYKEITSKVRTSLAILPVHDAFYDFKHFIGVC
jgi:hypothetical protein